MFYCLRLMCIRDICDGVIVYRYMFKRPMKSIIIEGSIYRIFQVVDWNFYICSQLYSMF
jgi:hypothetical protein